MPHAFVSRQKYEQPLVWIGPRDPCQVLAQEGLENEKSLGDFVARLTWVIHPFLSVSPL